MRPDAVVEGVQLHVVLRHTNHHDQHETVTHYHRPNTGDMMDFALQVHHPKTRTQLKNVPNYVRAYYELMKEELGSFNYEVLMRNKNTEECCMILKENRNSHKELHPY
ncbi:hypothetical protein FHG87_012825 [Trinorchestia longiramus]|nr:hypothetical protein FHG87_012825 [Trinorchestia longiramus]